MVQTTRLAPWTVCVLALLSLAACGSDTEVPGRSIEELARMAFDALRTGDLAPLRPALADDDDQAWFFERIEEAAGAPLVQAFREQHGDMFAPGALRERSEDELVSVLERLRGVDWDGAIYRGIDGERTEQRDHVESKVEATEVSLAIQNVHIAFLVEAESRTHLFHLAAFMRPGRGWVAWGPPSYGGVTGWSGPSVAMIRLAIEFERARAEGRIAADEDPDWISASTVAILRERLRRYGIATPDVRLVGDATVEVGVPAGLDPESLVRLLTALGDIRFRIQVLPMQRYPRWRVHAPPGPARPPTVIEDPAEELVRPLPAAEPEEGGAAEVPPRLAQPSSAPWPGSEQAFEDFKEAEVERWMAAKEGAKPYVPGNHRYFVAPRHGTAAASVGDFVVLEEPRDAIQRFDGTMLTRPRVGEDETGRSVVVCDIREEYQPVFGEWTELNRGLPLAILVDGEVRTAPVINERLQASIRLALGGHEFGRMEREVGHLVAILQTGSLKVPLRVLGIDEADAREGD